MPPEETGKPAADPNAPADQNPDPTAVAKPAADATPATGPTPTTPPNDPPSPAAETTTPSTGPTATTPPAETKPEPLPVDDEAAAEAKPAVESSVAKPNKQQPPNKQVNDTGAGDPEAIESGDMGVPAVTSAAAEQSEKSSDAVQQVTSAQSGDMTNNETQAAVQRRLQKQWEEERLANYEREQAKKKALAEFDKAQK